MWWAVLLSWWLLGSLAYSCPQHCRCFTDDDGYKVANCSKSGLLSGDPAPTIDVLNFKNQLRGSRTKLEAQIFRNFRGVLYLNLQNSSISHLPTDVFDGLTRVVRIDLSFNKIKHLNGVVFSSVSSLRYLSVRGNFLSLSPFDVIVSDTLQELDMGLCSITSIPLHSFDSAPNLRSLTLDGNFIQNLEYNVLPKGLTYLNLANNNIIKPPINVFNSLRHLIRLDISNNPINCSCSLLVFQDTLSGRAGILENDVVCSNPPHLFGKKISAVNENQLCRDDYINREGLNSLIHIRSKKSHHVKSSDPQVQSDEPLMMDESYGAREAAEVMFTNDETNQMGTHMESRALPSYQYADDNKLGETMDETTVVVTDDESPEADEPPQDLTKPDGHTVAEPAVELAVTEPVTERIVKDDPVPSETVIESSTSPKTEEAIEPTHLEHSKEESTGDHEATESVNDVETLPGMTSDHQKSSHLELVDGGTTTEVSAGSGNKFLSATEPSDYSYDSQHGDYGLADHASSSETLYSDTKTAEAANSFHTQSTPELEMDEGSGDSVDGVTEPNESSSTIGFMEERETDTESPLKTVSDDLEVFSTTSSDVLLDHVTTEVIPTSSEEPSSTVGGTKTGIETSSDSSSTEMITESTGESSSVMSSTEFVDFGRTTEVSSSTDPPEVYHVTSELVTTDSSTEPVTTESSTEPVTTESSTEPVTTESSTEPVTTESSTEPVTTESSTEPVTSESSTEPVTESSTEVVTSESSTEPVTTESSTEPVTWFRVLPEDVSSERISTDASSTELPLLEITSPATEASVSTEGSSREPDWWDSDEVEILPPSTATPDEVSSISPQVYQKKPKMIEPTTEPSVTPDVEVLRVDAGGSDKENIREDTSRVERENMLTTGTTFVVIGVLVALILILLVVIVCKKKRSSKKIRLPTDAEAASGTELQDMLLPKPPENGIKVLPKNYTNGATPVSNGRTKEPEASAEEAVPVLAPEPEIDDHEPQTGWEHIVPEPIEAVTARLTMLARPQTPIFIQKPLT